MEPGNSAACRQLMTWSDPNGIRYQALHEWLFHITGGRKGTRRASMDRRNRIRLKPLFASSLRRLQSTSRRSRQRDYR
jgi:hypothetical protein